MLCRQHHCYPQLLSICRLLLPRDLASAGAAGGPLSSSPRLHHYMAAMGAEEGAAERDNFANFVFKVGWRHLIILTASLDVSTQAWNHTLALPHVR